MESKEWYEIIIGIAILFIGIWIASKFNNWRKGGYR